MAEIKCPCGLRNDMEEEDCKKTNCNACCTLTKPQTNADRFRAMSDEEQQKCVRRFWEIEDFADWLKQPAAADLIGEDSCTITLQGWIFTKDAQPSEDGMYLAFADSLFPKGKPRIGTYYWTGSDWLDMLHIPRKVSHWMPLPDPPEGIWL